MKPQLRKTAEDLIAESGQAANPSTNGLLNRTDLEEMIARLRSLIEELLTTCQRLRRQRDASLARLRRTAPHAPKPTFSEQGEQAKQESWSTPA